MSKISIAAALELVDVSKTTLYRDLKENKLSATTDARGKKVIDTAELERFYGQLKSPPGIEAGNNGNSQRDGTEHTGTPEQEQPSAESTRVIAVLEDQVSVLKSQLESERAEKSKLIDMLAMEQEKTKLLMLPPPAQEPAKKRAGWLGFFRLKRETSE